MVKEITAELTDEQFDNLCSSTAMKEINGIPKEYFIYASFKFFRENKDEWNWYTSHGDLFLSVYRHPGDEDYFVLVTKDFYETYIPFEREDYE